jgi:hypothetical protein
MNSFTLTLGFKIIYIVLNPYECITYKDKMVNMFVTYNYELFKRQKLDKLIPVLRFIG